VERKWKNYHIITFPGQSLSKTLEEAMDLSQDRLILELESHENQEVTPWNRVLLQNLSVAVAINEISTYLWTPEVH
jgi:hypothetical protein